MVLVRAGLVASWLGCLALGWWLGAKPVSDVEPSEPPLSKQRQAALALENADKAILLTQGHLFADQEFGRRGERVVVGNRDSDIWAEVSFSRSTKNWSCNHLGDEAGARVCEGTRNHHECQIVAESHYRSKTVIAYCIVTGPPLPYSLGAAGKLRTGGNTLIGGVENAAALADGLQDDDLVEGGVVANGIARPPKEGEVPQPPMILESGVKVVGNAQSAGAIEDHGAVIEKGEKKPFADKQELPKISIADYDPKDREGVVTRTETSVTTGGPIYGFQRFGQSVTFKEEVDLNGALLFIDGDVTLEKPLKGTGALVATGKVTLLGGADMKADSLAAVLAGDDLTINGSRSGNAVTSNFMGLLYTEGNLSLSNTRTVGAAVAGGVDAEGEGSTMTIQDSEVLSAPEGIDVAIAVKSYSDPGGGASQFYRNDAVVEPQPSDFFVDNRYNSDPSFVASRIKVRYDGLTYDGPQFLPDSVDKKTRDNINRAHRTAVGAWVDRAKDLQAAYENKKVELVRFGAFFFAEISVFRSSLTRLW